MSKQNKKCVGVPRPKAPGRSTAAAGFAEPTRPPSRKRTLRPLKRGAICRMEALSGFSYHWTGMYARVLRCRKSTYTKSKLSVDFQPIGWSLPGGNYKEWDRAWFTQVLPAIGIEANSPEPKARTRSGKPGPKRLAKASPQPSKK